MNMYQISEQLNGGLKFGDGLKTNKDVGSVKLKTYHNDDYIFEDNNGVSIIRKDLVNLILNCIGNDKKSCDEISKELNYKYQTIKNILRKLELSNEISSHPTQKYTFYQKINKDCLLAELLYNKEKILKRFKIKSVTKRTVHDGTTKAFGNGKILPMRGGNWDNFEE